ncbi:MAG: cyclic nucleotide-binding domain-containing protein [Rhodospirillales bacterium]|nr:cyclic nucleotide-binding domain-containing protein [Rhodospirillales bacterium]MBO6787840.1 cyclic nucleotide-binding domain-containing protein [Rhodospirillales bacterium]
MEKRFFTAGEIIFAEDDASGVAYIIKSGRVSLTKRMSNGGSKQVAAIEAGSIIGEMSLIMGQPHSVTATATDDGEALILTKAEYRSRLAKSDKVLAMILKSISDRLRSTY